MGSCHINFIPSSYFLLADRVNEKYRHVAVTATASQAAIAVVKSSLVSASATNFPKTTNKKPEAIVHIIQYILESV